jgi:hypothetical protein
MIKKFKFNGIEFESFKEFQSVQQLALANGLKSSEEFNKFLNENYNRK